MAKVLFIKANPKPDKESSTFMIANVFVDEYKKNNPGDEVQTIDLYQEDIRPIDAEMLGKIFDQKDSVAKRYAELFASADKYIFAAPMWNLSFPAIMKCFLDYVTYEGITFKYTNDGPVGLLAGKNKRAIHIVSRGGLYSEGPMKELECGDKYLRIILNFIGVDDVSTLAFELTNVLIGKELDEARQKVSMKAIEMAKEF